MSQSTVQFLSRGAARPPTPRPLAYGAAAGARPAIRDLALALGEAIDAHGPGPAPEMAGRLLESLLGRDDVLAPEHLRPDAACYARHLLYADPLRRFSILALVWSPGQRTPIHGHTAWGAVGVHRGELEVIEYCLCTDDMPKLECRERDRITAQPGQTACARPGLADVHRIRNCTGNLAVSLHVYGRDLLSDPASLNIVLSP